jgi:hypothetical protein
VTGRLALLGTSIATLGVLFAIGVAGMLDPPVESRSAVDVPYEADGPVAQAFRWGDLRGWIVRLPGEGVTALSARSPHRGCYIDFRPREFFARSHTQIPDGHPGLFYDICFGSTFLLTGERTFGPSPRGMDMFQVQKVRGGFVTLDLSRVQRGLCGDGVTLPSVFGCSESDHPRYGPVRPPENPEAVLIR